MKLLRPLLSVLFLSYGVGVLSVPTPSLAQHQGRSFKVERVKRGDSVVHGPTALRKAYEKYGIVPQNLEVDLPDFQPFNTSISPSEKTEETSAVSASSVEGGATFVSPVTIGGQNFSMTFDTGSSDFWVMNSGLPAYAQRGRVLYDPSKSSTFELMDGASFNITYGDSSFAFGEVGTDAVEIGGATVANQAVGLPTEVASSFIQDTYSNGLVGLAFSTLNTIQPQKQKTFFENVADSLQEPVFTVSLKGEGVGEYEFGTIDQSKYQGEMVNVSVDSSRGFWQFQSAHFAVGDGDIQDIKLVPTAIADTGTSLMLLSDDVVQAYYAQVPGAVISNGAGGYIYPCSADLPTISIAVGATSMATLPASYLSFSEVGVNTTTGQTLCLGGIQSNQGSAIQILGDTFLKGFFVVFDLRGPALGFATPK